MDLKASQMLEFINNRLSNIEKNISRIDEKIDFSISLQRNHLIRIKNGENLSDNLILMGSPYNDLEPKTAYAIYSNPDMDYIILDVTSNSYHSKKKLKEAIHIPLEELPTRYSEIQSKIIPIMVISEVGLRSIQACEILVKKGYFNVNNISGGYKFWPEEKSLEEVI